MIRITYEEWKAWPWQERLPEHASARPEKSGRPACILHAGSPNSAASGSVKPRMDRWMICAAMTLNVMPLPP